jgi:hypothetical protein
MLMVGASLVASPASAEQPLSFNRDVRPILSDKCFFCHGPDDKHRSADLRLDHSEAAHESVIIAGSADESELIARLMDDDPDTRMPPPETGKRVSEKELGVLRRWIAEGALYEPYWAYVKPRQVIVPDATKADRSDLPGGVRADASPIDRLVREPLVDGPLEPAPRADRRTQLRRLHFDLTGLPPSYPQIESFEADQRADAYQRRVDSLLASPRFGEHFAEYWLDLVRFADTVGYHGDQDHNIAPYRDYVIDAINDNLPLDQFSREQLAGDLLDDPTIEQLVASGYNRLLQTTHEGGLQPKEYLAIYAADRVRNLSAVWMAATVGCAQCHDHKYDPYTAKDFYSLAAFFADVDEEKHFKNGTNALPTKRDPEIEVLGRTDRLRLAEIESAIRSAEADSDPQQLDSLRRSRDQIQERSLRTMITRAVEPRAVRLLPRGNWLDESGEVMRPAVPAFMGDVQEFARLPAEARATRLDLANWLFDVERGIGGLTARVFANRLWYLYSGRGISPTLGDFGGQGSPPTNPDLLDHLAGVLMESGWDIKATVRQIVTSDTYRQSVVVDPKRRSIDPYNDRASSQSGHRLPAETVRDAALEIAGLLDHQIGGRSVRPYQPDGYYRHLNFPTRTYRADSGPMQWRRGLYTHWQRQFLHPMLKALDAPSREECTAERPRSNTPLEALALLNDPTFVTAAKALAARILRETADTDGTLETIDARINAVMRRATGRAADADERAALTSLVRTESNRYSRDSRARTEFLKPQDDVTIPWPPESSEVERAAWSSVARVVLNLHETLYRP